MKDSKKSNSKSKKGKDLEIPAEIQQIIKDIEDLKIQGATAVAEAAFEGIKIYLRNYEKEVSREVFIMEVEKMGLKLVNARPNEPLAKNGLRYLIKNFKIKHPGLQEIDEMQKAMIEEMKSFERLLDGAKADIVDVGVEEFGELDGVLTHCHSSTVENIIKGVVDSKGNHEWFSVVATETRPRYQGRITAKNLSKAGIEVLMIVDNAITSFLAGDWTADEVYGDWGDWDIPVDAVFIGCDEICTDGDTINKVGSYGLALSAYYTSTPIYVMGTILKLDPSSVYDRPRIEMRSPDEIWEDAPSDVRLINPAFEIIPDQFITGFVTEFGILKPDELEGALSKHYEWIW
jgi:ribose 1,5-bisphosphate isomerase